MDKSLTITKVITNPQTDELDESDLYKEYKVC